MGLSGSDQSNHLSPIDGSNGLSYPNHGEYPRGDGSVVQCAGLTLDSEEGINGMLFQDIPFELECHANNDSDDLPKNIFGSPDLQQQIRTLISKHSKVFRRTITPESARVQPLVLNVDDTKGHCRANNLVSQLGYRQRRKRI
jgi:hypothetical protein